MIRITKRLTLTCNCFIFFRIRNHWNQSVYNYRIWSCEELKKEPNVEPSKDRWRSTEEQIHNNGTKKIKWRIKKWLILSYTRQLRLNYSHC